MENGVKEKGKNTNEEKITEKLHAGKAMQKGKKTFKEFKDFISKGNVIDLAVGVIIGSAFSEIVSSIVDDILMPIIGAIIGGINFSNLSIHIGEATITYGNFIQNVINFLIIAFCIFMFVKIIGNFNKKEEEKNIVENDNKKDEQIILLEEIRDLLKDVNQNNEKGEN